MKNKNEPKSIIADTPPLDGFEYDCSCARCGSDMEFVDCNMCGGLGYDEDEALETGKFSDCELCNGKGGDYFCVSSKEWCENNPSRGKENIPRGKIEWFRIGKR